MKKRRTVEITAIRRRLIIVSGNSDDGTGKHVPSHSNTDTQEHIAHKAEAELSIINKAVELVGKVTTDLK